MTIFAKSALAIGWLCLYSTSIASAQSLPAGAVILTPAETVVIEHQDRARRLYKLARPGSRTSVSFDEYVISPADHKVATLPINIPVLRVVFDTKVFFDFDKDAIRPEAQDVLDAVTASLRKEPPDVSVFVAGHTDGIGGDDYNNALGLRRAQSVAEALSARKLRQVNIYRVSFGRKVPIASNDSEAGRSRNRRVEFLFSAHANAIAAWLVKQKSVMCEPKAGVVSPDCKSIEVVRVPPPVEIAVPSPPKTAVELPSPPPFVSDKQPVRTEIDPAKTPKAESAQPKKFVIDLSVKRFEADPTH